MAIIQDRDIKFNCDADCPSCTYNNNPLLAGLDYEKRLDLDNNRNQIIFKKGEAIYREGVFPFGLYCLRKGKVKITKTDSVGNEIILHLHRQVTFLGVADFISNQSYQSSCIALEETQVCLIQPDRIHSLISEEKVFATRLMATIASHYHRSNTRMLALTKKNMGARLADALLEILDVFGETQDGYLNVYMKRAEIANLSNMSQANIIRKLSAFQESGIISIEGKLIKVLDKTQLEKESKML